MEISVIVPVYNVEKYVERCITSLLGQTFRDFEVVLVDDGCTDSSMRIVERYAQDSPVPFTIVHNERNMGLMWTRRAGYKNARGRYFVFCDSDDFLPENALQLLYDAVTSSSADMAAGNFRNAYDKGVYGAVKRNRLSFGTDSDAVYKSMMTGKLYHSLWAKIYDRRLFDGRDYDTFENQTIGEDAILSYQIAANVQRATMVDEVVYYYYCNRGSSSRSRMSDGKLRQAEISIDYVAGYIETHKPHLACWLKWRHTVILASFLLSGLSKKQIAARFGAIDVAGLSSRKSVFSCYGWKKATLVYLLLNSCFIRSIYRLIKSVAS